MPAIGFLLRLVALALSAMLGIAGDPAHGQQTAPSGETPALPPVSKVGRLHRDATGKLVVAPAAPEPVDRATASPPAPSPVASAHQHPAAPSPPNSAAPPLPARHDVAAAAGPDQLDEASCRAYAWQPGMTLDGCRRELRAARQRAQEHLRNSAGG